VGGGGGGVDDDWDEDGVWVGAELEGLRWGSIEDRGRVECRFGDVTLTENNE